MKLPLISRLRTWEATLVFVLLWSFSVSQLEAADRIWNGLGTNNNWTTSSNWNAVVAPGDSLFFAGTTRLTPSNDFLAGATFTNITFNSGAGAFALLGNLVALTGNITNNQATSTVRIGFNLEPTTTPFVNVVSNGSLSITGAVSGSFGLTKTGPGLLTLSGANTFTGAVLVAEGTVRANNDSALGVTNGTTTVNSGATLDVGSPGPGVNGLDLGDEQIFVIGIGVNGLGAIVSSFNDAQQNALQRVTLTGDTIFGGTGPWTTSGVNPGRWDIRGTPATAFLSTGGQPYNLTKTGSNEVRLAGVTVDPALADINILQGALCIEGTTTSLGNPTNTLTVFPGATLEFAAATNRVNKKFIMIGDGISSTIDNRSGNNTILGSVTLSNDCVFLVRGGGTALTNRGPIGGSGALIKTGGATPTSLLVLTATNTYTGDTMVSLGTLVLSGTGSISNSANITVASGATLDANGRTDRTLVINSGQTLKGDGTVLGRLTIAPSATIAPGTDALGFINVESNADFSGIAQMEIHRTNSPTSDRVTGISTATYGGTLTVSNVGPALQAGDCFTLFAATNYTGSFVVTNLPPLAAGLGWDASSLAVNGSLCVVVNSNDTNYSGIQFTSIGGATLLSQGGALVVTNPSPSGPWGVQVDGRLGLEMYWKNLGSTNLPAGAYFEVQMVQLGQTNPIAILRDQWDGSNWNTLADYSAAGATNGVLLFNYDNILMAHQLVALATNGLTQLYKSFSGDTGNYGNPGGQGGNPGNPPDWGVRDYHTGPQTVYCQGTVDQYFIVGSGGSLYPCPCDVVVVTSGLPFPCTYNTTWSDQTYGSGMVVSGVTGLVNSVWFATTPTFSPTNLFYNFVVSGVPALNITNAYVKPFGLPAIAQANTVLSADPANNLMLQALDTSTSNGISVFPGRSGDVQLNWADLRSVSNLWAGPTNSWIETAYIGSSNGVANQLLATTRVTLTSPASAQPYTVSASPTLNLQVEVLSNNIPVTQMTLSNSIVAICSTPPVGAGKLLGEVWIIWNFPLGTSFVIAGQTFLGDTLRMAPQSPVGQVDFHTRINLQASGLPLVTVTNIQGSPPPMVSPAVHLNQFTKGKAALEWVDPRFHLESTTNLIGSWTTNAFPFPQAVAMTNQQQFFRLRAP